MNGSYRFTLPSYGAAGCSTVDDVSKLIDMEKENMGNLAYGPVPSRRLGRSLGINNIPAKYCPYSCAYCQVGKNKSHSSTRRAFYDPDRVFEAVKEKVDVARSKGERIDYLAFVPDGEPTLDANLGMEVALIKQLGLPVAVITNASILSQPGVPESLKDADLVSLKVDACNEKTWKKVNRPCKGLNLATVLDGITCFAANFKGSIITETMVLDSIEYNDELRAIASFIGTIASVENAYISIPTRPPAERWVTPTSPAVLKAATDAFEAVLGKKRVKIMNQYEGNAFSCMGELEESLLDIVAVHPMREDAAVEFLAKGGAGPDRLDALVSEGKLKRKQYMGHVYFLKMHETDRPS